MADGWLERLIAERNELGERTTKLKAFVVSDPCDNLDEFSRDLLHEQLPLMEKLHEVLTRRVTHAQRSVVKASKRRG